MRGTSPSRGYARHGFLLTTVTRAALAASQPVKTRPIPIEDPTMNILRLTLSISGVLVACYACSSSSSTTSSTMPPSSAASQIEAGKAVFADHCARCHGDAGQGSKKAPPLVGKGALPLDPRPGQKRTAQFRTAMDVAAFATKNMPPDESDRAEMSTPQYWSVVAFALSANGVKLTQPVGPDNAPGIMLH
jgi:mono/diheme cytochrome c family protein